MANSKVLAFRELHSWTKPWAGPWLAFDTIGATRCVNTSRQVQELLELYGWESPSNLVSANQFWVDVAHLKGLDDYSIEPNEQPGQETSRLGRDTASPVSFACLVDQALPLSGNHFCRNLPKFGYIPSAKQGHFQPLRAHSRSSGPKRAARNHKEKNPTRQPQARLLTQGQLATDFKSSKPKFENPQNCIRTF